MTTALERGEGLASRHARFTPGKDPVPIVQEAGWAPGRSGQVRKMSPQPGFDSPDRPARSQSLYRTELPGPHLREHSSYIFSFFSNYYRSAWYYQIFFYLPTDAQENCYKNNIKIYIKTAPTCFGVIAIIRERISRAC